MPNRPAPSDNQLENFKSKVMTPPIVETPLKSSPTCILALLVALSLTSPAAWCGPVAPANKPNIIIILADDVGYGDLSCYGSTEHRTPHLDTLAREGMRFTDFHANGPMCSPTRAALLTGRYQQRSGLEEVLGYGDRGLPLEARTIAEYLRAAGYATGIYGKWHLGYPPEIPTRQGFDDFRGYLYGDSDHHSRIDRNGNEDWWHNEMLAMEEGYNTYLINRDSLRFIEQHQGKPFFLYVAHSAVHFPWQGPHDKADRVKGGDYNSNAKYGSRTDPRVALGEMLEAIDDGVGQIVTKLRELRLEERTLVFFTSDNGGYVRVSSNGPLRGEKGSMYEGGHREPAIAWWPGRIKPDTVCRETTMTMDLLPTALDLCGQPLPRGPLKLDGVSLVPVLSGKRLPARTLFWRYDARKAARQGPWKLVVTDTKLELFNLDKDLGEQDDLADRYPKIVKRLSRELAAWEKSVNADGGFN